MKVMPFLAVTAVVELVAGLALLVLPGAVVGQVIGSAPAGPEALVLARWLGVALVVIGVTSGLARGDPGGPARRGVLIAVVLYDVAAALLFVGVAVGARLGGPALWPAVGLHTILAVWGLFCLAPSAGAGDEGGGAR